MLLFKGDDGDNEVAAVSTTSPFSSAAAVEAGFIPRRD